MRKQIKVEFTAEDFDGIFPLIVDRVSQALGEAREAQLRGERSMSAHDPERTAMNFALGLAHGALGHKEGVTAKEIQSLARGWYEEAQKKLEHLWRDEHVEEFFRKPVREKRAKDKKWNEFVAGLTDDEKERLIEDRLDYWDLGGGGYLLDWLREYVGMDDLIETMETWRKEEEDE